MHCTQGVTYCTVVNWVIPGNTERHKRPHKKVLKCHVIYKEIQPLQHKHVWHNAEAEVELIKT